MRDRNHRHHTDPARSLRNDWAEPPPLSLWSCSIWPAPGGRLPDEAVLSQCSDSSGSFSGSTGRFANFLQPPRKPVVEPMSGGRGTTAKAFPELAAAQPG
jgi:hypothetical protein